jgi:prepilin-type N-terminal cleavage/methylation domain-containing protein
VNIFKQNKKGFTLIELLAVLALISLVSTLAVVVYGGIRSSRNDTKRLSDINLISKAMDIYYDEHKSFPTNCGNQAVSSCVALQPYIPEIDKLNDPSGEATLCSGGTALCNYSFGLASEENFEIFFYLENPLQATNNNCNILGPDKALSGCDLWGIGQAQ